MRRSSESRSVRALLSTATLAAAAASTSLQAQATTAAPSSRLTAAPISAGTFELSIANMMRGPEVYGREPGNVRWSPDGRTLYFSWLEPGASWRETPKPFRVRATAGATPERMTASQMDDVAPLLAAGSMSPDGKRRVVEYQGDLHLVDVAHNSARRLTETTAAESEPVFGSDGRTVYFVRDNNAWALALDGSLLRQLTDVRSGTAPDSAKKAEGQRGALQRQQRELLDPVRDRLWRDSVQAAERAARDSTRPRPFYLPATERVASMRISPDGRSALLFTAPQPTGALATEVPQFVTASGYTERLTVRTKVGDAQAAGRVAFVPLAARGAPTWLTLVPDDSNRAPSFAQSAGWNADGSAALVLASRRDYKARYLQRVDASGEITTLATMRDSAWVGGPCNSCMGWTKDGQRAWYVSEATGYAHLYSVAREGGESRQLTSGNWEVLDVDLAPDGRTFRLHTSEGSPFERHFFTMPVTGGARTRLTSAEGGHTVVVSPDGRTLADVHSTANRPPELFVVAARNGAPPSQLTTSPTAEWRSRAWIKPAIVMIPASDGVMVPARIYRPEDMGVQPNGAAAIFVHGAGYLHNVHNYWSSYAREYMFNQLLASKGYTVLDVDYRGSAGYGRDWRTAIYRHMGGRDLQDHVDASRWLQKERGIDPERVGLYGGSYGGFITLMALFTEPKHFGAGAALRSVTDWSHYNHPYTAQILNLPQSDTLSYRRSSPIYFAEGLEDPLLMAHGMVDVNVQYQDIVRLQQRLIDLGKTDWTLASYPVEDHGFVRPTSWTDEYVRIMDLFDRHLATPKPATGASTR